MSNSTRLTAEQAEEEFGPLWDVLGMGPPRKAVDKRHIWVYSSDGVMQFPVLCRTNMGDALVRITYSKTETDHWIDRWIEVEQARILKQLLLGK